MYSFKRLTSFYLKMSLSNADRHSPPFHLPQFMNHSISLTTSEEPELSLPTAWYQISKCFKRKLNSVHL